MQLEDELRRARAATAPGEPLAAVATLERHPHDGTPPEAA